MSTLRMRSLSVGPLRAFEAVSRSLNFRIAAEELHLTQPAVSRQIKVLEEEVGAVLLERDTRRVRLTAAGITLLQSLGPWLARVDQAVRQIRQGEGRRVVSLATFASLATQWLIPRLDAFRQRHAVDVRVLARDQIATADAQGADRIDAVLRYCRRDEAPEGSVRLFDEVLMPVASPSLLARSKRARAPLRQPSELAGHTLIEDLDLLPSAEYRSWAHWLRTLDLPGLQPRHWLYFNLAHQQVQAAIAGHGVAMGRLPLVIEALTNGELVEPFAADPRARLDAPYAYWLIAPAAASSREGQLLRDWIVQAAAGTRAAMEAHLAAAPASRRTAR